MILSLLSTILFVDPPSNGAGAIHGHQDQVKTNLELLQLEVLNIQMDTNTKQWWGILSQAQYQPSHPSSQGKGGLSGLIAVNWQCFSKKISTLTPSTSTLKNTGNNPINWALYIVPSTGKYLGLHERKFL